MNLIVFLIFFSLLNKKNKSINFSNNSISSLNVEKTNEKINTLRKIAPYFPEEYIPIVNNALLLTSKIITIYEATNFIKTGEPFPLVESNEVENNKERLNYIIKTLKKEVPDENIKSLITNLEMIINIDKYKDMIALVNSVMSNTEKSKDIDKIIDLVAPFMENVDEKQKQELLKIAGLFQK